MTEDARFDYFVVLAGMRTGSNLLEEQLAAMPGIAAHGELFNPHFFGKPGIDSKWGLSVRDRNADPIRVVEQMKHHSTALPGFRLFFDHDLRAIDHVLADRRAAKVILTRRPIDSYVSLKIARKTGQWWLGDMTSARAARVEFVADEYAELLNELAEFQDRITRALQTSGQTAFHISYDDLSDLEILAGLGKFLGSDGPPDQRKVKAKVQNPTPVESRLTNPSVAEEALSRIGSPDIGRLVSYEPDRGPGMRFFRVGRTVPLIYMPIRGAWDDPVPEWLKKTDPDGAIDTGMTQRDMRRWKRQHPGHRSFTVLRHPLPRVHDAFCKFVLVPGAEAYADVRDALISQYDVPLPQEFPDEGYNLVRHRQAFLAFLEFLAGNLGGQTSVRVDSSWASQYALVHAIAEFAIPDRIVRSEALSAELAAIADEVGYSGPPVEPDTGEIQPFSLSEVVTPEIEKACARAYRRDYVMFGFDAWCPSG
ncbi:MAG: nodulation protein NodH [Silicimonas sp.]|nr:nodulation protein NodH [Silicimonas sp.]